MVKDRSRDRASLINNLNDNLATKFVKLIADEQKDEKYFERRKRNNLAAKKSRDQVNKKNSNQDSILPNFFLHKLVDLTSRL